MKRTLQHYRFSFLLFLLCRLAWPSVFARPLPLAAIRPLPAAQVTVVGYIKDKLSGKPLSGVEIMVEAYSFATLSDASGRFMINDRLAPPYKIFIDESGYEKIQVEVTTLDAPLTIELLPENAATPAAKTSTARKATAAPEYAIKLSLLEKLPSLVAWPDDSNVRDLDTPFMIGIYDRNPFGEDLRRLSGTKIKGKTVVVSFISSPEEIAEQDMLFIPDTEKSRSNIEWLMALVKGKPMLVIGDGGFFDGKGTTLNLAVKDKRMQLTLDEDAADEAKLELSVQLVRLATIKD